MIGKAMSPAASQPASYLRRPERASPKRNFVERWTHRILGELSLPRHVQILRYRRIARRIMARSQALADVDDSGLRERADRLRERLSRKKMATPELIEAFALVREAAGRTLGMRHFEAQLIGGLIIFEGAVAEMATGEGKTLVATLPATTAALAGIPVHVVTVNDYLTARDAETMGPVYAALGVSVGHVVGEMQFPARRAAYAQQVTYCTNKELVFDYLKDQLVLRGSGNYLRKAAAQLGEGGPEERLMLRGLHFAIVDEADSILVDEARTPLIISGPRGINEEQRTVLTQAMEMAVGLEEGRDFKVDSEARRITIEDEGLLRIRDLSEQLGAFWRGRIRRVELMQQALYARNLLRRDEHYLVREEKIQIVDELTGRIMEDRTWEKGLHQMVELKEQLPLTDERETLARISYQRFFRKYFLLAGMTGTASELKRELWQVYALSVRPVPLHRRSRRMRHEPFVALAEASKWERVCARASTCQEQGRAVLIGTQSVGASETLSAALNASGVEHRVLNAKQDAEESAIIARAGEPGCVTVATSMAGRGTDIVLSADVRGCGGLHVILTDLHEASRIDRQLVGRCARQGDPGSFEYMISLDDNWLMRSRRSSLSLALLRKSYAEGSRVHKALSLATMRRAQRRLERAHVTARQALFEQDQKEAELLAFAGSER